MKKHLVSLLIMVAMLVWFATPALAGNDEVTFTVDQMVVKLDKNGQEYVRFIGSFTLVSESGVKYPDALPFMAFGALAEPAKAYKVGDEITVIAKARKFQDRESYTILKFLAPKSANN